MLKKILHSLKKLGIFCIKYPWLILLAFGFTFGLIKYKELTEWARKGKVWKSNKVKFIPVPNNDKKIMIHNSDGWQEVQLPKGVNSKFIKAAGITKTGNVLVEIKHNKINIKKEK